MSDTPITDAAKWHARTPGDPLGIEVVAASCASDLERQLSEVTAQRDTLETALKDIAEGNMFPRNRARLALAAVKGADAADSSAPVSKNLDTI